MDIPPWYWISRRRRRRESHAKNREIRLYKYNGINILSPHYQKKYWRQLQKSICFFIKTLNQNNISLIRIKLLKVNLVRGKGLFCHFIMNAQSKFTDFTDMYADLISLINFDFPNIGELLIIRCIVQFRKAFHQNDEDLSVASIIFIAHLIKRNVASDILALDLLKLLGTSLNEHSIQLICNFLNICGDGLAREQNENDMVLIFFRMLRYIFLNKADKRISDMVYKVLRQFQNNIMDRADVDLVLQSKQITHSITLNSATDPQYDLNYYERDIDYEANERLYFQSVFKKIHKYEFKYSYNYYNSDDDADDEEESSEETY